GMVPGVDTHHPLSRSLCGGCDDAQLRTEKTVQKRRLAGVRQPDDRHETGPRNILRHEPNVDPALAGNKRGPAHLPSRLIETRRPRPPGKETGVIEKEEIGGDVLSHRVTPAVPSAQRGLTSEFGMGSGGSPAP